MTKILLAFVERLAFVKGLAFVKSLPFIKGLPSIKGLVPVSQHAAPHLGSLESAVTQKGLYADIVSFEKNTGNTQARPSLPPPPLPHGEIERLGEARQNWRSSIQEEEGGLLETEKTTTTVEAEEGKITTSRVQIQGLVERLSGLLQVGQQVLMTASQRDEAASNEVEVNDGSA